MNLDDDNIKRQYYGAYLMNRANDGGQVLEDDTYAGFGQGGGGRKMTSRSLLKNIESPLYMTVRGVTKGFVPDNYGNTNAYDLYNFGVDYDKLNKERVAQGKKPYDLSFTNRLETWATKARGKGGFPTNIQLTPEDKKRFDQEYQ